MTCSLAKRGKMGYDALKILTNDAVCVTITPIVIEACRKANMPLFPFLMGMYDTK